MTNSRSALASRAGRFVRRVVDRIRWRGRVHTILTGPAAGLLIHSGAASADYASGTNEEPVQAALVELLRPGHTFLDIGANVGFFSLLGGRLVGPHGRVIAFEAVPYLAGCAKANALLNGFDQIRVHAVAVGAEPGHASMSITGHAGGATLAATVNPEEVTHVVDVTVVSISALVNDSTISVPDLIKIDVEGHELAVLEGMASVLETRRPAVIVELDAQTAGELDTRAAVVERLLDKYGYEVRRLQPAYIGTDWKVVHLCAT